MKWIEHYQLFLFDFDGVLVNTEELHYRAYLKMCTARGFSLKWDQRKYMGYALYSATAIKENVYREFPELQQMEPSWDVLYQEKKRAYYELLQTEGPPLMPGVAELLEALAAAGKKRCVVTHSPKEQIDFIKSKHPILNSIPNWITREHYSQPKPHPECYQKAISLFKSPDDRVIGFEDSPRGLKALLGAEAEGILLSEFFDAAEIKRLAEEIGRKFYSFRSFSEIHL